nr:reverse transcriptase domain-containing protein [Tanacetum cinerariifolium]
PLPSKIIANPKGELKAITTRSSIVLDGHSALMPHPFINPKEDERVVETLTDPELGEFTIKVPPPLVQKAKPPSQRNYVMLKALLSNKEKLLELANTPLNDNCLAVILKKLPKKHKDPGKFLILCGFSELKCKALVDLGVSINLMPFLVLKKLGLTKLISTRMTLELANRTICTPVGTARDVFVPVGQFTYPADFVIVDYESCPRFPLILGRPFLWIARALIDVYKEEMILHDGELKAITTRSGIVLDGHSALMPHPFINPKEDERVVETLTVPELGEFTIKVPPPLVLKAKPPSQRNYVVHQRDPLHPNIPYPSRTHKQKQQAKDEIQIHKF